MAKACNLIIHIASYEAKMFFVSEKSKPKEKKRLKNVLKEAVYPDNSF